MQNRSRLSRTLLVTACVFSCAGQVQASVLGCAGNALWNSQSAELVRCTTTGAISGAAIVTAYFAYNGGFKGNVTKIFLGAVIGGGFGMLYSQRLGVKAGVRRIEAIVKELNQKMETLSTDVQKGFHRTRAKIKVLNSQVCTGFVTVQQQLANISNALSTCVSFEALEKVKNDLLAFINHHAQDQKYELNDIKKKLERVECNQGEMKDMLQKWLARHV